jgi:serine protease Do
MRLSFPLLVLAATSCAPFSSLTAQYPSPKQVLVVMQPRLGGSYLGVGLLDIDGSRAKAIHLGEPRGVEVMRVEDGGPADEAGIRAGDVLLSYNGETITGAQQVGRLVAETPVGRKVKLEYWRAGKQESTFVVTGSVHFSNSGGSTLGSDQDSADMPNFPMMDIPDTLLVWKNSALGIVCESLGSQLVQYFGVKQGVLVRSVDENSPAAKSGVRAGDVITAIGRKPVSSPRDVSSYLRMEQHHRALQPVALEVTRDRKPIVVKVSLQQAPE